MRTGRVIGLKDSANEQEEIQDAATAQSRANGLGALAFAEPAALDMRMRDFVVLRRTMWRLSGNFIGLSSADGFPGKDDLEASQVYIFENDGRSRHCNRLVVQVNVRLLE